MRYTPKTGNDYFEFTGKTKLYDDGNKTYTLNEIITTEDIEVRETKIPAGTLGGWVENKDSLKNNSWIDVNSNVCGNTIIDDDTLVIHSVINGSYIFNSHIKNSDLYKDYYKESLVVDSTTDNNEIRYSSLNKMYVSFCEAFQCTLSRGFAENSKLSGVFTDSEIENSKINADGNNTVMNCEIKDVAYNNNVYLKYAEINGCTDTIIFSRVGWFEKDLIIYRNKFGGFSAVNHLDHYESLYELEYKTVENHLNDDHAKNIKSYIDIVQRKYPDVYIKRLSMLERSLLIFNGLVKYMKFI